MSKIPIPEGGFRSWLAKNEEKPAKNVIFEQKFEKNHRKFDSRSKENMADGGSRKSKSPNFVSMVNPIPTDEDYARYDEDRRIRERARDARVALRSAENSRRNSLNLTPEKTPTHQISPGSDQYFTPKRTSGGSSNLGEDEQFVTPSTSKRDRKERKERSERTPVSSKPPKYRTFEEQMTYTECLSRRMEKNFQKMEKLVFSGESLLEARQRVLREDVDEETKHRSPRNSSRRNMDAEKGSVASRSSSQPPPIETINSMVTTTIFRRAESPETRHTTQISRREVIERPSSSYVEHLIAAHQMHTNYADNVVPVIEKQMTKLESMKLLQNLAALGKSSTAAAEKPKNHWNPENFLNESETEEQKLKKLNVIRELKDRISKVNDVQISTHNLISEEPFKPDSHNERLLKSIDTWISLPFEEFNVQTAKELQLLNRKLMISIDKFRKIASLHRQGSHNRSFGRKSTVVKILPSTSDFPTSSSESPGPPPPPTYYPSRTPTKDSSTQVSARFSFESAMTQTSPRRLAVEPLDFSKLRKSSTTQTTPKGVVGPQKSDFIDYGASRSLNMAETNHNSSFQGLGSSGAGNLASEPRKSIEKDSAPQNRILEASGASRDDSIGPQSFQNLSGHQNLNVGVSEPSKPDFHDSTAPLFFQDLSGHQNPILEASNASRSDFHDSSGPQDLSGPQNSAPTTQNPSKTTEIDEMLNNIVLNHNESLESIPNVFKTDISYPSSSTECTPRSGRVSMDSDSARRLSAGISHFLEKIKLEQEQEQEEVEPEPEEEESPKSQIEEEEISLDDVETTQFEHEKEEAEAERLRATTPVPPPFYDPEDEEDETKKFVIQKDEFEKSFGDDDEDDDSGFLLNDRPAPKLKSIFDGIRQADTPRLQDLESSEAVGETTTTEGVDMEEYCQTEYLKEISPIMVQKAIEHQNELRGADWVTAQSLWQLPSLSDMNMDFYDPFDYFDSFSIQLWGTVVDLMNRNYLKFGRSLTDGEKAKFEKEAIELLEKEFGGNSKKVEWCREVKLDKKLAGMMPFGLDYRYDVRRGLVEQDKQKYIWQQVQMKVIAERYPRKQLIEELNHLVKIEKIRMGEAVTSSESSDPDVTPPTGISDV